MPRAADLTPMPEVFSSAQSQLVDSANLCRVGIGCSPQADSRLFQMRDFGVGDARSGTDTIRGAGLGHLQ